MRPELEKKIQASIRLLQSVQKSHEGEVIEIAYSGGKDSDVILQLAKEAGINYRAIYKNTTIDPPGTISHCKRMGVEILQPKKSFFKLIEERGFPHRTVRFCCSELKEYKVLDVAVMGIRREESWKRAQRYKEPIECRFYGKKSKNSKNKVQAVYPILDWTLQDVKEFILDRGIQLAPRYYDEDGTLHIERRLGCVSCPLAGKDKRLEELKKYPNMVKAYVKAHAKYFEKSPHQQAKWGYRDVYERVVQEFFYIDKSLEYFNSIKRGGYLEMRKNSTARSCWKTISA